MHQALPISAAVLRLTLTLLRSTCLGFGGSPVSWGPPVASLFLPLYRDATGLVLSVVCPTPLRSEVCGDVGLSVLYAFYFTVLVALCLCVGSRKKFQNNSTPVAIFQNSAATFDSITEPHICTF